MDFNEKNAGVFRWLESLSEYTRGLLGLGTGLHSTECHSSQFISDWLLFSFKQIKVYTRVDVTICSCN